MDDIIVYLIFLGFALLSRLLTKKKEPKSTGQGRSQQEEGGKSYERPKSFEELLRDFTEGGAPPKEERQERSPKPVTEYSSYEDEPYEVENYEDQYSRDEEAHQVYEKSIKQAKNLKTIDELVDYDSIKTTLDENKFDPYSKEKKTTLADEIRNDLQNSNEVRKAVIYAEILQRKY